MADIEREYWLAGGADLEKAKAFIENRHAALVAMTKLAKKHGADQYAVRGPFISGLFFPDDKAPAGWRDLGSMTIEGRYRPFFFPSKRTKALKEIAKELTSIRAGGAYEFSHHMNGPTAVRSGDGRGMRMLYTSYEWIGDDLLITVPLAEDERESSFKPDGSRKLAMSEYWAMKERDLAA